MAKSKRPTDLPPGPGGSRKRATAGDGRRNNRTPEHGKIRLGEVRNPDGRRGKAKAAVRNPVEDAWLAEAYRVIGHDRDGPVHAYLRLIQEDIHDALVNKNEKARVRVLAQFEDVLAADAVVQREAREWLIDMKATMSDAFRRAELRKLMPPDAMHPDHVIIGRDGVHYTGPMDILKRERWELLKSVIRIAQVLHAHARRRVEWDPSPKNMEDLAAIEQHRRKYMRKVPKGWNWRERIYTRWPDRKITDEIMEKLEEKFDAECRARDRLLARRKRKAFAT
jgi:hypothetical protein